MSSQGNFENLAVAYQQSRRGFDNRIFDFLGKKVGGLSGKKILDVGCGTGIATRELKKLDADVKGTDIAEGMLNQAKQYRDNIAYTVARADKLPFADNTFDIVTAFSAFHWFYDKDSVGEIKRVLKNGGMFAVINKNDVAGIRTDVTSYFKKYTNGKNTKDEYNPEVILKTNCFGEVSKYTVDTTESYSEAEALKYLQSIALWNSVSEAQKGKLLGEIREFCNKTLKDKGVLERKLETTIVVGLK